MRPRSLLVLVAAIAAVLAGPAAAVAGAAPSSPAVLAQQGGDQPGAEEEAEGQEGGDEQGTGAETGAGQEEREGGETEETGPPWTYQMARLTIVLLVLLFAGIGWWYYRYVVLRQRGVV